jgi:hypothetical protein
MPHIRVSNPELSPDPPRTRHKTVTFLALVGPRQILMANGHLTAQINLPSGAALPIVFLFIFLIFSISSVM